jgi:glycosyltransferase involved in cell wall biosynthesis
MSKNKKLISIIVPCYNEEESIPLFYKEIEKVRNKLTEVDFEYIFIDDGCKDNSLGEIRELARKNSCVRYISMSRNFGKEAGMYAGLEASKGDYVAIMDVDLQDPPEMILDMYKTLTTEDYDCVALHSPDHKDYGFVRKLFTKMWYSLIGKISTTKQVAGARDFRLMKRKMVDAIISMKEYNRYSKGIFSFVGYKTKWIKYETPKRVAGKTKWSFWKLFKYALEGILAFSTTPLVMAAVFGLILCFIAFVAIIVIIVKTLVWGDPVGGWPSLACIIIFTSGLQLFFLGIIGMYLSKTYLEVKNRPIYFVRETEEDLKK